MILPNIHMVGVAAKLNTEEIALKTGSRYRLYNYEYVSNKPDIDNKIRSAIALGPRPMLDSGAYQFQCRFHTDEADSIQYRRVKGGKVAIVPEEVEKYRREYYDYCTRNKDSFVKMANLDWIRHARTVWYEQKIAKKAGLGDLLPGFHGDDGFDWMKRYVHELGHDYIGIGRGDKGGEELLRYCDSAHTVAYRLGIRLHGYKMTDQAVLMRYPWYSVDSSTWTQAGSRGCQVLIAWCGKARRVNLSLKTPKREQEREYPQVKEQMDQFGFDFSVMRDPYRGEFTAREWRDIWNMHFIQNMPKFGITSDSWIPEADDPFGLL